MGLTSRPDGFSDLIADESVGHSIVGAATIWQALANPDHDAAYIECSLTAGTFIQLGVSMEPLDEAATVIVHIDGIRTSGNPFGKIVMEIFNDNVSGLPSVNFTTPVCFDLEGTWTSFQIETALTGTLDWNDFGIYVQVVREVCGGGGANCVARIGNLWLEVEESGPPPSITVPFTTTIEPVKRTYTKQYSRQNPYTSEF